jgi:hypothetical protein
MGDTGVMDGIDRADPLLRVLHVGSIVAEDTYPMGIGYEPGCARARSCSRFQNQPSVAISRDVMT